MKKKNQINKKKKKGGQNGKVNACAPVSCSLQERLEKWLETSRHYLKIGLQSPSRPNLVL